MKNHSRGERDLFSYAPSSKFEDLPRLCGAECSLDIFYGHVIAETYRAIKLKARCDPNEIRKKIAYARMGNLLAFTRFTRHSLGALSCGTA